MKAFLSPSGLNYAQAVAGCRNFSSEIAQPLNPVDSNNLFLVLTNDSTLSSTSFWIGSWQMRQPIAYCKSRLRQTIAHCVAYCVSQLQGCFYFKKNV
jgi:hypothetical protein